MNPSPLGCLLLAVFLVGRQSEPSGQAWNRPRKSEISSPWLRVGNPEAEAHAQEYPYP
ncbi:MAG: hypothetical protein JNL10_06985 [Verrucomicrobiales bacterium]|nr:hypothetical protein [Verrucomicrobiales bacterium]